MATSFKDSLKAIQASQTKPSIANTPMPMMLHPDTEPEITVDMDERTVTVPDKLKNIGVVADNNAETVYIRIPTTTFDGIDLTDKTAYVAYVNAGNDYGTRQLTLTAENDTIKLGWTIDNDITHYAGTVYFQITFELGTSYKWSTIPASINVLAGLDLDSRIPNPQGGIVSGILTQINEIKNEIDFLKNGVFALDTFVIDIDEEE